MKTKPFFLCHLLIAFLLTTFLCPYTKVFWDHLDRGFFHLLNDPMENRRWLQYFWAFSNHKMADWVEDGVYLLFFASYIVIPSEKSKSRKTAEVLFSILLISIIVFFINRILFREHIRLYRDSPTLVIDHCVRLSQEIPWLSIKDFSLKCFPADHATTAILLGFTYSFLVRGKLRLLACLYSCYLCLPRMATGAHWLSDVLVGSGTIALFFLSWAYCLPVQKTVVGWLERLFSLFRTKKIASN